MATAALVYQALRPLPRYSDEIHHFRQIRGFCEGDYTLNPRVTTIPGYHVVSALVGRLTGDCSTQQMRLVNTVIGLLSVAAFLAAIRAAGSQAPVARTLQYFFLPVLLPYHFFVYADSISLLANLATLALLLRGRFLLAGLAGSLAILVRQTNVVWLALVCVTAFLDVPEARNAKRPLGAVAAPDLDGPARPRRLRRLRGLEPRRGRGRPRGVRRRAAHRQRLPVPGPVFRDVPARERGGGPPPRATPARTRCSGPSSSAPTSSS